MMSDIGFLSHEYAQASRLAENLEEALAEAELAPQHAISLQRRQRLSLALRSLVDLLEPEQADAPDPGSALALPVTLVRQLRKRQYAGSAYSAAIAGLADRLRDRDAAIENGDVALLRELAGAAETEATRARRRMVRR